MMNNSFVSQLHKMQKSIKKKSHVEIIIRDYFNICIASTSSKINNIQGVLLPDLQTLRGYSRHEDKHYQMENHEEQTFSVGARGH